jgi:hypothetical protein
VPQTGAGGVPGAREIHVEHPGPLFFRCGRRRAITLNTSARDENVDALPARLHLIDRPRHLRAIGDINP